MILANLGKMASMFLFNCLLIHISECFPTKVRSVALGSSAMASRIGAMAAPFLKQIVRATVFSSIYRTRLLDVVHRMQIERETKVSSIFQGVATASWVPMCITISVSVVALLLSFLLPETFGEKLPDTFHEAKQMIR